MKVTIEHTIDGVTHKAVVESTGETAMEVLQECLQCMAGVGFAGCIIKEAVLEKADECEQEDKEI
jgi:hypothetical protein